jgi:hypothetical protein
MALSVYVERNQKKTLAICLEFDSLEILQTSFEKFRSTTGVLLSEYDDVMLAPSHSFLLAKLIDCHFGGRDRSQEISKLSNELKRASDEGVFIDLVGE